MQGFMIALLTCSVTMSALALFYMAITPLLSKRYSAKGRYYTWLIVVIGLIIPFRPQFDHAVVKVDVPPEMILPIAQLGNGTPVLEQAAAASSPTITSNISMWQILMIIWLVGGLFFLVYHAIKHRRFVKLVGRWSENVKDEKIISVLDNLKSEMGISKSVDVQLCSSAGSPMMISFIHPQILLPQIDFSPDEIRFILAHELVHYKRKDLWYKALILLATAIHWFNPVVYFVAKAIDIQCELSCDNAVIHHTDIETRRRYSETIIGVVRYQSKMKTALSTNFYGGKKGMKKRIFSIMDTGKKKVGVAVLCGALLLTLGTGFAFAANAVTNDTPQNTPVTHGATADKTQIADPVKWEPLPEYEQFGISYDTNGKMLFNGEIVRFFWDGAEIEPGKSYTTHYDYLNEAGVVDVHTVRSVIDNGDGSVDVFGELLNVAAYSQQEFDARNIDELKGTGRGPVATAVDGGGFDIGGRTFADIFLDYKDYGIEYVSATAGTGNIYYQGQLVKTFIDEKNRGGVFMLSSIDGGEITVRTVYDNSGKLIGVKADK